MVILLHISNNWETSFLKERILKLAKSATVAVAIAFTKMGVCLSQPDVDLFSRDFKVFSDFGVANRSWGRTDFNVFIYNLTCGCLHVVLYR